MATREEHLMFLKEIFTGKAKNEMALENIKEEHEIVKDLGVKSVDVIEAALAIEEKYDIEIDDNEMEKIVTVGDVIDFLMRKVG